MDLKNHITEFLQNAKQQDEKPLIAILGATASGKTGLSVELAKHFDGEIISADSSQVYKYMNIATAKVTTEEMQGIPHYMIDVVEPDKEFTLADFLDRAKNRIEDMYARKKLPILVGGTGLYVSALCQNYKIPRVAPNVELRTELEKEIAEKGETFVYEKLKKLDPKAAEKIDPRNHRYLIRALEITMSGKKKQDETMKPEYAVLKLGIEWSRETLYERIDKRVHILLKDGLVEETQELLSKGYDAHLRSMQSLGYPEMIAYINGELSLDEATALLQKNTRNYAKRQLTWLRREKDVQWLNGEKLPELIKNL